MIDGMQKQMRKYFINTKGETNGRGVETSPKCGGFM